MWESLSLFMFILHNACNIFLINCSINWILSFSSLISLSLSLILWASLVTSSCLIRINARNMRGFFPWSLPKYASTCLISFEKYYLLTSSHIILIIQAMRDTMWLFTCYMHAQIDVECKAHNLHLILLFFSHFLQLYHQSALIEISLQFVAAPLTNWQLQTWHSSARQS